MTAAPLAQEVLGEPVNACAGYAGFVERTGRSEFGMRWRPDKWGKWIDATSGAHVSPLQDIHVWLETRTHVIDFTMGDTMGPRSPITTRVLGLMSSSFSPMGAAPVGQRSVAALDTLAEVAVPETSSRGARPRIYPPLEECQGTRYCGSVGTPGASTRNAGVSDLCRSAAVEPPREV